MFGPGSRVVCVGSGDVSTDRYPLIDRLDFGRRVGAWERGRITGGGLRPPLETRFSFVVVRHFDLRESFRVARHRIDWRTCRTWARDTDFRDERECAVTPD